MLSFLHLIHENPVILAPVAGVSNLPFRKICRKTGARLCFTEMVSCEALIRSNRKTMDRLLDTDPDDSPTVVQIFGGRPQVMAKAAAFLNRSDFTAIDINMGCPAPKVGKSGGGVRLMKTPELASEIVRAVSDNTDKPVTVKIRLGLDSDSMNYLSYTEKCVESGAAAVTLHPRTAAQKFTGRSDWSHVRRLKEHLNVPVIGSGDIRTTQDAVQRLNESDADGLMIARGAFGNPWIFREVVAGIHGHPIPLPPTAEEKVSLITDHIHYLKKSMGEHTAMLHMRKHLAWYTRGIHGAARLRGRINSLSTCDEAERLLKHFFSPSS